MKICHITWYDEICNFFAKGKQKHNDANEVQKHLQLHDLSVGEYSTNKYALWLDFRMINANALHRMGRRIENALEGITLQIEKKVELAGNLKAYIYLIMDAQLNIKDRAFTGALYQVTKNVHTALFMALTGVGQMQLALDLLEWWYLNHFDFIVIICTTLQYNKMSEVVLDQSLDHFDRIR